MASDQNVSDTDIAIIGISCRFPGAKNADEFWQNLRDGVESIAVITENEMRASLLHSLGYVPETSLAQLLSDPHYVRAGATLADIDLFDADFFGYNAPEAEIVNPQQRIFLESAWEALEDAGYTSETCRGLIGVYAGADVNSYYPAVGGGATPDDGGLLARLGNENDYLTTRVSYKLDLKGPSFDIQSACSTSLVAIHAACQSLKSGECDVALAGGVVAYATQKVGYFYQEGGMVSPDGHCRVFDAQAQGTVFAKGGVGVIVLKRLVEALTGGDNVYAVIKGSATNNDGSIKTGYTAPSIDGQIRVLKEAWAVADVHPESISYIEAHGTATPLGDPIEVAALTQAFRSRTKKRSFCAIGSVKSNIGHLGAAAGVAGLIKTTLALKHRMIPPSLHYEQPNPQIDFASGPFYVNSRLSEWKAQALPRRAGVSSFGMGGSNAHLILEEAPLVETSIASRSWELLILSAKTDSALETMTTNLISHLKRNPDLSLPDLAFTLQVGRKTFPHRRMLVCRTNTEAMDQLATKHSFTSFEEPGDRSVAFMFSGQGVQYVNMGLELYQEEMAFREQINECAELLTPHLAFDLREVLYPAMRPVETTQHRLDQTLVTQPALFVIEYAMAKLWIKWGVHPKAMIGHSIGEYVAACLAGVFSLEDALALVAVRAQLMQDLPGGAMLSISLPETEVQAFLSPQISLAANNGATDCVVSGSTEAIERLEQQLIGRGIAYRRLRTSHAFHSQMMDPILERFTSEVSKVALHPPRIPYVSNLTGTWITAGQATDPGYWAAHLRQTVRFAEGLKVLLKDPRTVLLEMGPGRTLTTLAKRHPDKNASHVVLSSLHHVQDPDSDVAFLLNTLGRLWCAGISINWSGFYANERRRRVSLPTYPFERKCYWKYPHWQNHRDVTSTLPVKKSDIADWFSIPSWKRSVLPTSGAPGNSSVHDSCWLIFTDVIGLGTRMIERLKQEGQEVITVMIGEQFSKVSDRVYTLHPNQREDYDALLKELWDLGSFPTLFAHFWTIVPADQTQSDIEFFEVAQSLGFYSLLFLTQALGEYDIAQPVRIATISNNLEEVIGGELLCPVRATVQGLSKVISYEYPDVSCCSIDVIVPESEIAQEKLIDQLLVELRGATSDLTVAYRGSYRWVQTIEPMPLERVTEGKMRLRDRGVYLITGGLGGIGLVLAEFLARSVQARLVLVGRSALPKREEWEQWLATHDERNDIASRIRQVQLFEELGAEVLILSADVTDRKQMQILITQVYERFGELHGVIHAAGIPGRGIIQLKTPVMAASVLAPKVKGTLVLQEVLKNAPLDFIVLCSSLYSVIGGVGQADYCAANAFLDSFAFYNTSRNAAFTLSINWDAWQEVGMAVNAAAASKPQAIHQAAAARQISIDHPFLERCVIAPSGEEIYTAELSIAKHWILDEHRILGTGVVSGTSFLEMVRAAFEMHSKSKAMEIRDVFFFRPLKVEEEETREIRLVLKEEGENFSFLITSRTKPVGNEEIPWLPYAEGKVGVGHRQIPESFDIPSLKRQMDIATPFEDTIRNKAGFMQLGPRWNVLKEAVFLIDEGLAVLELAEDFSADLEKLQLHPALLDVATSFVAHRQAITSSAAYLPFSYKRLNIIRPLQRRCVSHAKSRLDQFSKEEVPEMLVYDIVIMDEQGALLVEIEDFSLRRVDSSALQFQTSTFKEATLIEKDQLLISKGDRQHQPIRAQQMNLKDGILPKEGIEAFKRILSQVVTPQIIVSARDVQSLLKQANNFFLLSELGNSEQVEASPLHSRPNLQASYVAPRNELEQLIADIWQRVLGIDKVGVYDNFFEVGGDSVMIILIISRLREAFQVELSMPSLFRTPTIEGTAKAIIQKQMELIDDEQATELLQQVSQMSEEEVMLQLGKNLPEEEVEK